MNHTTGAHDEDTGVRGVFIDYGMIVRTRSESGLRPGEVYVETVGADIFRHHGPLLDRRPEDLRVSTRDASETAVEVTAEGAFRLLHLEELEEHAPLRRHLAPDARYVLIISISDEYDPDSLTTYAELYSPIY